MNELFLIVPPGLEAVCAAEARALGRADARAVPGGVVCAGGPRHLLHLLLWSRIASRVLVRLCEAPLSGLRAALAQVDFAACLPPGAAFAVEVSGGGSRPAELSRPVEETIRRQVPGARPAGKGETAQTFAVRLEAGRVTVSADAAGEHLHLRGYRQETGAAPLRENLAAGVLSLAGWAGTTPLVDPMCGSGTFVIEGAMQALHLAPGLQRAFACEAWPALPPGDAASLRAEARQAAAQALAAPIIGRDRNAGALGVARRNAQRAGVLGHLVLERADATQAPPPAGTGPGLVVANPPYGKRVGEARELAELYRGFGAHLRRSFAGWTAAVLVPEPRLEPLLGFEAPTVHALRNGGLPCRLLVARL